ncbi:hypothetical protein PGT21_030870 [Puccinia graminis f. sp. tritici]|uniref:Uncharacterized protein n=1 Tax=Puccinia graminis f. sp. tritici TaxID=56615 RepID=A0A5B0M1K6_PUCGR|nr:hypothetical protein PGT21_030870 [Puccinia graminis f. sp. tritici]
MVVRREVGLACLSRLFHPSKARTSQLNNLSDENFSGRTVQIQSTLILVFALSDLSSPIPFAFLKIDPQLSVRLHQAALSFSN